MSPILGMFCVVWASSASLLPGRTVARLELSPPAVREFVLHATLPVPRGTFPRPDGLAPFGVRDIDGTIRPAQVEIVSRYPSELDGADVVEISARVHRGLVLVPAPVDYDVVFWPHTQAALGVAPEIEELLRENLSVRLVAHDVFGNEYALAPLSADLPARRMRDGSAIREVRTHGSLLPVNPQAGSQATLPHLLGVHAYARIHDAEPFLELDLRIHNGHSGLSTATNQDDPLGSVYFDRLDLELPKGWLARDADPDSFAERPYAVGGHVDYPIIKPLQNGKLHVMRRQSQTTRRIVIYKLRDESAAIEYVLDRNLAFARRGRNAESEELFSWWNADTARYFPQRNRLPDLVHVPAATLAADLDQRAATLRQTLATGIAPGYPIVAGALGWANPYGVDSGGMAGGDGIVLYEGLRALEAASNAGWRALAIEQRMYTDRNPVALFNLDGEPTDYLQWVVTDWSGRWLPIWCFGTPLLWAADPFGFTTAPTFQVNAVHAQQREPPYEATLANYQPIDFEHYVRCTSSAKALAWIGNDSLAKDALFLSAALFRLSYNELPNSQYGDYITTGLGSDEHYVAAHPGNGFTFGRLEAWGIDSVAAAYSLEQPGWRSRVHWWFERVVDLVDRGQSQCSGIIQAMMYEQLFQGHYRARQSIEQAITEHMLVAVRESVMRGVDPVRTARIDAILSRSAHAMATGPCWSDTFHAPWSKLAVGDGDFTHPPFCGSTPADGFADGGDSYQTWCTFAYAYEITHDPLYLQRAAEMAGGGPLLAALQAQGLSNLENRAALLALAQKLP